MSFSGGKIINYDDTVFHKRFGSISEAHKLSRKLRDKGYPSHAGTIDGDPVVWLEGKHDERKILESIDPPPEIDCVENFFYRLELCSMLNGGCEHCCKSQECIEFTDDRLSRATHHPWKQEVAVKMVTEFNFWFGQAVI